MAPKPPKPSKLPKPEKSGPKKAVASVRRNPVEELLDRVSGVRLCYGEPVREGGRTVIPVARVRAAGGGGWGSGGDEADRSGGGGGGGSVDALPVGFIEVGPDGARYQPIDDPEAATRAIKAATAAVVTVATTLAGLRAARGRRLLGRGR